MIKFTSAIQPLTLVGFVVALAAMPATAQEIPEHYVPVGPQAMGGAYTGIANDENAIWTNPAGIARVRKARSRDTFHVIRAPTLVLGANAAGRGFIEAFQGSQEKSVEEIVASSSNLGDKPFWARSGLILPQLLFDFERGMPMGFTLFSNTKAKAVISKDSPEQTQIEAISDIGAVLSYAWTNQTNRFNIGFQLRPTYRYAYEEAQLPTELLTQKKALQDRIQGLANRSQGVGVDFGVMYTLADFWFPTIGFSILNLPTGCRAEYLNPFSEKRETVCGNKFSGSFGNDDALSTVDPTDIRLGLAITPRFGRKTALRFGLDAHHLAVTDGTNYYGLQQIEAQKLLHGGVEFFFGNPLVISPFSLRAGYGQGFISLGGKLIVSILTIEFASYGQDVSTSSTSQEDRRYLLSIGADF